MLNFWEYADCLHIIKTFMEQEYKIDNYICEKASKIPLAYTTSEDGEHEIQVELDLIHLKFRSYIDDELKKEEPTNYDEIIQGFTFDDLISWATA